MMFSVYKITSPSQKSYIGITKKTIQHRWSNHIRRAFKEGYNHPFANAIRKYGPDAFEVEELATYETEDEAKSAEIYFIDHFDTTNRDKGYNISKGGDYDAGTGGKVFWDRIRKDPEALAVYIANLKAGINASMPGRDYTALKEKRAKWLIDNPEKAEEAIVRLREGFDRWEKENPEEVTRLRNEAGRRLSQFFIENLDSIQPKVTTGIIRSFQNPERRIKHAMQVADTWASYTEEERRVRIEAAAEGCKKRYARMDAKEKLAADSQLAEARKNIDHEKRKRNQKEGQTRYWTPERRAEWGEKKKQEAAQRRLLASTTKEKENDHG